MSLSTELLLVEDDLLLARAFERTLTARGARVHHVACCSLAALLPGHFPIGVFDIELPDGDGIELARLLRSRGVVGRVVFYTACTEAERLARAREIGSVFVKSAHLPSLLEISLRGAGLEARPIRAASRVGMLREPRVQGLSSRRQ